jgi:signal transduction histidine kinase
LENVLPGDDSFYDFRVEHDFEHIGERVMLLNARRIDEKQLILLAIEDCTEREMAMQRLQAANKELEERAEEVRTLASRLTRAEQVERHRIAELLHDDLQQHLYGIQMKISRIRRQAEGALQQSGTDTNEAGEDGEGVLTKLIDEAEEVSQWLEDALTTTKNLTVDLSPPVLEGEGLPEALAWLRSQMEELHGLSVEIETGEEPLPPLEEDVRVLLFQSVREALFNTVKHAGVERAAVSLSEDAGDVVVRVSDEGKGFDPAEALEPDPETEPDSGGFGLRNLRERLDFVGGQVEIDSAPGEGTRVTIRMPARPESP